jgi:hypothetical protein
MRLGFIERLFFAHHLSFLFTNAFSTSDIASSRFLLATSSVDTNSSIAGDQLKTRAPTVIEWADCYVRWQPVRPGQQPRDARVTKTVWSTTAQDVTTTIKDFGNIAGANTQLWLSDISALLYAGFFKDPVIPIIAQSGLNADNVMMSIILPSGVAKLKRVNPVPGSLGAADDRATAILFGIALKDADIPLTPSDYAYAMNVRPGARPNVDPPEPLADDIEGIAAAISRWKIKWDKGIRVSEVGVAAALGDGSGTVLIQIRGLCK